MAKAPYLAMALQANCQAVNMASSIEEARRKIFSSIEYFAGLIKGSIGFANSFHGTPVKLIVLPEYFLTGFPLDEPANVWLEKACLEPGGREYERLGEIASGHQIFLSGNAYESDPNFPGLYFQTSFIIAPSGEQVLRYHRLVSMYSPTPHDLLDQYIEHYGKDALFPVADTEIGRLACVASEEILYPEITRALALKGAEVICHSSSEVGSPLTTPKNIAKQARAYENMAYVVSANSAAITDLPFPEASTTGGSRIVSYRGLILEEASAGESMVATAEIDIEGLRRTREKPAMSNTLARQRLELFKDVYSGESVYPANTLVSDDGQLKTPNRAHFMAVQEAAIESLKSKWRKYQSRTRESVWYNRW